MRTPCIIHLHGKLAEFGEEHRLCVSSPVDAYRSLATQLEGFAEAFKDGAYRLVRGENPDEGVDYSEDSLHFPVGPRGTHFHIIPQVAGAKSGGGKFILGAVIVAGALVGAGLAASAFVGPAAAGTTAGSLSSGLSMTAAGIGSFGVTWGGIAMFGGMLMFAGVAQMLQPGVKSSYNESAEQKASFFLGGQVNQAVQGGPVVLAYGRCRVGTTVVSAGLSSERI